MTLHPRAEVRGISSWKDDFFSFIFDEELARDAPTSLQSVNKLRGLPLGAEQARVVAGQGIWPNDTAVKNCYRLREGCPPLPQNDSAVGKPDRQPTLPIKPSAFTSTK